MANYEQEYLLYCSELNNGFSKKDVKKHNVAMKKLGEIFYKLKKEPHKEFLLNLLSCDDKRVVSLVAAHCLGLGVYVPEAEKALCEISKDKENPLLAFEAQSTLEVWKQQGYLKF